MSWITGTALNDTLSGGSTDDYLFGFAGHDLLSGGAGTDVLIGADGNDTLNGGSDADTLNGGVGNDRYLVDNAGDQVIEGPGEGIDTVLSSLPSYTLPDHVENLILTGNAFDGYGNALDNLIIGNAQQSYLDGMAGNDTLVGGAGTDLLLGNTGDDVMIGGSGNDFYFVDSAGDTLIEAQGEGFDVVFSSVSYTLSDHVEDLNLTDGALDGTGSAQDNRLFGNTADNHLSGLDGNDYLDGGAGADVLTGGRGNDSYMLTDTQDQIIENAGEGQDQVYSGLQTYTLGADLENLSLLDGATEGWGNDLDNLVVGTAGDNWLHGAGGRDTLLGDAGDDILTGGEQDDWLLGGSGNDYLDGGTGTDHLQGGTGADYLYGQDGNDLLDGGEGVDSYEADTGQDTMVYDPVDLSGGQGYPVYLPYATGFYDGGGGVDTLRFTGNQTLDLFAVGGNSQIVGIEVLNLDAGANSVRLDSQHVAIMTDNLLLRIDGQSDDHFTSTGQGWSQLADTVLGSQVYHHYVAGNGAELLVDTDIAATVS